eukprot:6200832-Pleurochrysis_carterae.AAC.2
MHSSRATRWRHPREAGLVTTERERGVPPAIKELGYVGGTKPRNDGPVAIDRDGERSLRAIAHEQLSLKRPIAVYVREQCRVNLSAQASQQHLYWGELLERHAVGEHLPAKHTEGEDIARAIVRLVPKHLGSHPAVRAGLGGQ